MVKESELQLTWERHEHIFDVVEPGTATGVDQLHGSFVDLVQIQCVQAFIGAQENVLVYEWHW